ncbi:hypothetical protein K435DRAFT_325795 [Dendrothele bispora CBS 962.96]|uniref:Uncharacterized protein n=1 Tax=Dendrothele bispora (strain CBS 962.96) TaxID=1314807 RepID=A0A4S8LG64_DENBC|nr:hypothetical protein K435DRAFT_325795 [Dendrothele bispora CBS 962.96]
MVLNRTGEARCHRLQHPQFEPFLQGWDSKGCPSLVPSALRLYGFARVSLMTRFGRQVQGYLAASTTPRRTKQNLAKAAVKIQAMTEDFLDTNSAATYPTVSPAMIEFVNKQFWPQMLAKCNAIRRHYTPWFIILMIVQNEISYPP